MKFLYNGKVVRKSERHIYRFAILNSPGRAVSCSSNRESLEKIINQKLQAREFHLKNAIRNNDEANQKYYSDSINQIKQWQIVELEAE